MNASTGRRIAAGACLWLAALATTTARAVDAAPAAPAIAASAASAATPAASAASAPKSRSQQERETAAGLLDPRGASQMTLSPDGKHIAAIVWDGYSHTLLLVDTAKRTSRTLVAPEYRSNWSGAIQPLRANWISNEALAVDFNDGKCTVVGFDGRRGLVLGDRFGRMIASDTPGEPAQWAIVGEQGLFHGTLIHRVNVVSGETVDVPIGLSGDLVDIVFDRKGRLRAATTRTTAWRQRGATVTNWYRHDEHSPWVALASASITENLWRPLGIPDDTDSIVALSREGRDTWAMVTYDVASRKVVDLRVGHPTEDLIGAKEDSADNLIRVTTHGLKPSTYWFDARWNQLQRAIDQALPEAVNVLQGDPHGKVLVLSYSDRDPGTWMLLDTADMSLHGIGRISQEIDADTMRPMQTTSYPSADGLTIPAYLTLPAGPARPRAMVVYIHGGPVARDEWGWDLDVQALAAAGYVVFQPQFRGSSGFGRKFEEAGYRQWGLAMQDDVTAGVKAMIARGIADPARICIYGASYGGYAALWGLVKTPELYKCGVSVAGVTDIGELFSDWSDTNEHEEAREWRRFAVGDLDTMAAQFAAVSPEKHAAQIHVPVMLAHGTEDRRVPIGHSKRMAAALKAAHGNVETHWYEREGHGLSFVGNHYDFEWRLLEFIDRSIGPDTGGAAWATDAAASAPAASAGASSPKS